MTTLAELRKALDTGEPGRVEELFRSSDRAAIRGQLNAKWLVRLARAEPWTSASLGVVFGLVLVFGRTASWYAAHSWPAIVANSALAMLLAWAATRAIWVGVQDLRHETQLLARLDEFEDAPRL